MIKTFTQTDLIRYLYHETTAEETEAIDRALERDARLKQLYYEVCETLKDLDEACLQPSSSVISKIVNHSRATLQSEA